MPPILSANYTPTLSVETDARVGKVVEIGFARTDEFGALLGRLP